MISFGKNNMAAAELETAPDCSRLLQNQPQKMSAEHEAGCESDDHQRDVIELAGAVGSAVENNRNGEDEHAKRERDTRLGQAHSRITGRAAAARRGWSETRQTAEAVPVI